jgi:hypothetical protein
LDWISNEETKIAWTDTRGWRLFIFSAATRRKRRNASRRSRSTGGGSGGISSTADVLAPPNALSRPPASARQTVDTLKAATQSGNPPLVTN